MKLFCSLQGGAHRLQLQCPQTSSHRLLSWTRSTDDLLAQAGQLCHDCRIRPWRARTEVEASWIEQAVALANEAVDVGKRSDCFRALCRIVCHDSQPQSQLGETYGCRIPIDPEESLPEDPSLPEGAVACG